MNAGMDGLRTRVILARRKRSQSNARGTSLVKSHGLGRMFEQTRRPLGGPWEREMELKNLKCGTRSLAARKVVHGAKEYY